MRIGTNTMSNDAMSNDAMSNDAMSNDAMSNDAMQSTLSPRAPLLEYIFWMILPFITWLVSSFGAIWVLAVPMSWSLWFAVPVGLVIGLLVVIIHAVSNGGASTTVELNISCGILLVVELLLFPTMYLTREKALHRHSRRAASVAVPSTKIPSAKIGTGAIPNRPHE